MKATLTNYHQSPRKVRLVANMIRGKSVTAALSALSFLPKKSSPAILKLLNSAVANARSSGASTETLVVKTITVNKGSVLRRFMPKARGRAARYAKTMSIVTLELGAAVSKKGKTPKAEKPAAEAKPAKKTSKPRAKKVAA